MKYIYSILLLLMLNATTMAQLGVDNIALNNNDFLYERYAQRTDITVAQILDFPIDSNMFVNIVMLQADNDNAWERLKEEYDTLFIDIPEHDTMPWRIAMGYMDHDNPPKVAPTYENQQVKELESCFAVGYYHLRSILLIYYNTLEESDKLFHVFLHLKLRL